MSRHDINLNVNYNQKRSENTTNMRRAVATNVNDTSAVKRYTSELKKAIESLTSKTEATIEKMMVKMINDMSKGKKGAGGFGASEAEVKRVVKGVAQELANSLIKSKTAGIGTSERASVVSTHQIEKAARDIANKLDKLTGIKLDTRDLQTGLDKLSKNIIPPSTVTALKDISTTSNTLKTISRDITTLVSSIKTMRASGGGIDISEIGPVISALKKLAVDVKTIHREAEKAKDTFSALSKEVPEAAENFKKAMTSLKTEATKSLTGVAGRAKEDPKTFAREFSNTIISVLKKSEAIKGTDLEKFVKKLEATGSNIEDFTSELKRFKQEFKKTKSEGKISIEGFDKVTKDLNNVLSKFEKVPKDLGFKELPKQVQDLFKQIEKFSKFTSQMAAKITVDDSEYKAVVKKIESKQIAIPANVDVDTRKAYTDTIALIGKLKTEADKKSLMVKVQPVIERLEKAISANDKAALTKELQVVANLQLDASKLANEIRKAVNLIEGQKAIVKVDIDDKAVVQKAKKTSDLIKKTLTTYPNTRALSSLGDPRKAPLYKANIIKPSEAGEVSAAKTINILSQEAKEIKAATEMNIKKLSSSLYSLQKNIVDTLDKQFEESGKKWAVVKSPNIKSPSEAFKLAPGGRQWTIQIANADRLQRQLKDFSSSIDVLVKNYKTRYVEERASATGIERIPDLIGQWLKSVSSKEIRSVEGLDDVIKERLVNIRESSKGVEVGEEMRSSIKKAFGEGERLVKIFKQTYAESEAKRTLQQEGLVKTLALPVARTTTTGEASFQTVHGAQRALPKFARFETGFEVLYKRLNELGKIDVARDFAKDIKTLGIRPSMEEKSKAEELSEKLLKAVADASYETGTERKKYIQSLFLGAAAGKGPELERAGLAKADQFEKSVAGAIKSFNALESNKQTFTEFINVMKQMNLTAYDVVKSLNTISSENVYDILNRILEGDKKKSPLRTVATQPHFERSIRNFESAINEIEGTLPLLETNRPRRGYHQESVVNLLTRTSPLYSEYAKEEGLGPDAQKKLIKDLNLELSDTLERMKAAGKPVSGITKLTSLGIPEAQAGKVEEYRYGGRGGFQFLPSLKATSVKLYAEDLTSLAPFQQFQQAGRNISNVTNAMADLGKAIETPKLRSERERALIESGRYGQKGYGYNVVAELRNTAATFEDQILISGKLAKAATSAVKTLVRPSPAGRVHGATVEERITGTGITGIKPGEVSGVAKEFMKILGVPEKYEGRADKALIDAVEKTVSVVRGESVEVQQAKLAETFLNYFGRKLTTRYGSKGVSITPTGQPSNLADILSQYSGKKVKVEPEATLGYQVAPKSLGQMVSELFGKEASEDLKKSLVASGNKFMIDLFQNAEVVSSDEADRTKKLYDLFAQKWQDVFKSAVPTVGPGGIESIRSKYKETFGEKAAFELKPIDVRISSYGAAKRGLQTEFLESIVSNIAGAGAGGVTTLKQLKQPEYERMLKGGALSQYSKALGYKGAGKTEEELAPELYKLFGGKGSFAEALASGDEKAALAKRAAALEAMSNFYSTVIDEFGKIRPGLVGEKFLQIVEEPHFNPEWQRGQVERGLKGAKLNLPAFSAYATIFGEQSSFMKEIQGSLDINAGKHWEYLKALQALQEKDSQIYQNLTKGLKTVDIGQLREFSLSTGVYGKKYTVDTEGNQVVNPRSFTDTILDVEKYAEAFKLAIPTGKRGPAGEIQKEEFYVPGAVARGTFKDPLLAGERGLDIVSRRLTQIVNMAKELEEVMSNPEKAIDPQALFGKIPPMVANMVDKAWKAAKSGGPEAEEVIGAIMTKLAAGLSKTQVPSPALINTGGKSELEYSREFYSRQMAAVQAGKKTRPEALATTVSTIADLLVGKKNPASPEQKAAPTALTRSIDAGTSAIFAKTIGIDLVQGEIDKRVESLQKAKIDYYETLAGAAVGKSGVVENLLFNRKIPAVMGRAVNAVVDKRKDIDVFQKRLRSMESRYGESFSEQADALSGVAKSHAEAITGYQKTGVPVLKQEEIGVPEAFASKVPLEFVKKFKVAGEKGILAQKPEAVKGTLLSLLKYIDKLQSAVGEEGPTRQQEITDYIENELVPYIESIRYPFTGTSSVAPFKPKLLKEGAFTNKEGRPLERNALIVPGVPEGLQELSPILEQLQSRMDEFVQKREALQTTGGSQEEIDRLTSLIRELNAAISDVIPKYTAQAQKLDFDGDQIEIHAAKTADARKDIAAHFKRFHETPTTGAVLTQDVFMKRFMSEAANVPTTGPYVFGEAQKAFEKKFPAGKGFEFLKSPFLTKELEYLSPRKALGVLQGGKEGDISNIVKNVLLDIGRPEEQINKIMMEIGGLSKESPDVYIDGIMRLFESSYTDILKQVESGIKKQLYESKLGDTVEAQLFKIHTGPETEAMYRIHRMAESAAGFGGGLISGGRKSTEYFKKRFPDVKALGGKPEEEFHTMMNEVMRFGIQKGMDVKHAGEKPVIGEMLSYLTRGSKGASELWSRIQDKEDKTFGDLRDFAEDNEKAIRMRLGELPTSQVLAEAKQIATSRGQEAGDLDMRTREDLIKIIVEKIGFRGFLEELSLLVRKEAVEGLVKQAESWTPAKKQKPGGFLDPVKGDIRQWAETQISKQIEQFGGINIRNTITAAQIPLYTSRTATASPTEEYRKFSEQFGRLPVPQEEVSGIGEKDIKSYQQKYREAKATALNLQRELRTFAGTDQPGAYSEMIKGTMDALYTQQAEIENYVSSLVKEKYSPEAAKAKDLTERVLTRQGVSSFANTVLDMKTGLKDEVERLSDLAGVPGLSDTELYNVRAETSSKLAKHEKKALQTKLQAEGKTLSEDEFDTLLSEKVETAVEKAQALKQLDRVIDALSSKRFEGRLLQDIMPTEADFGQSYAESHRNALQEAKSRMASERKRREHEFAKTLASTEGFMGGPPKAGGPVLPGATMPTGAGPVPVYIVGADPNVTINVRGLIAAGLTNPPTAAPDVVTSMSKLQDVLSKISPTFGPGRSSKEYFTPSRLSGGGDVYSFGKKKPPLTEEQRMQEQLERLVDAMTTETEPTAAVKAITDWGTVLHAVVQKSMKDKKNIDIEKYGEIEDAIGGVIGGTADVIEYETPDKNKISKIIDIKSATPTKVKKLQAAIEKAGTTDINEVMKQVDDDLKRQLNDYFSQLNTYLKIFDETAEAQIRFYDKEQFGIDPEDYQKLTLQFDPSRFEKDMKQLSVARQRVAAEGKSFVEIANKPVARPDIENFPTTAEMAEAMQSAKTLLEMRGGLGSAAATKAMESNKYINEAMAGMEERAAGIATRRSAKEEPLSSELYKHMLPPDISIGTDTESIYKNLKTLQEETVMYQKLYKGLDLEDLNKFPEAISDAIKDVSKKGPNYDVFIELTNRLKELDPKKFSGKAFMDSWKAYRLAVGDWLLAQAEEARKQSEELDKSGDIRGGNRAYGTFRKYLDRYQEFVKRGLGKRTDVFTEDKRFVYPALAQAAGVYMSPEQIHKKIGGDLGEDEKLIKAYKEIIKGLETTEISPSEVTRKLFGQLSDVKVELASVLTDAEKFGRLGPEVVNAWDFGKLTERVTRLRTAMQKVLKESGELDAVQRKNIENIVKYLKNIEGLYSHITPGETKMGDTGIVPVSKTQTPKMQAALHARNIQAAREYLRRPEEGGGLPVGGSFSYAEKIIDQAGQVVKNVRHDFTKYGEEVLSSGEKVGLFSEKHVDLIEKLQRVNASFGNAIRRVVMWGAASRLVYGGISYLTKSLGELSEIETGMAQLRMVMNPMETDFNKIGKAATGFAKQYGVPVTDVLKSMKIFAQQGLKQEEVLDRTQTATLASNVTTLSAKEATEALTAAMKVYREEGNQSLRFLDAWSEVEAKHAVTADDMANAIKKSAAAAKTAGFTFDQLNGIVAAIGATTRQSGKEVGTSMRFIARRLFIGEGPKELAKLPTPIATITGTGELRKGFDVLSDLSAQWKDLTSAQKLNIAQSIGGTRQYNALLVLMDQWDEALRGIRNSTNSKGSAERRNLEIMKTYAKQMQQAKAAATELKMQLGKIVLPTFKTGLHALKLVTEAITNIPAPIKIAATGLLLMFGAMAKGVPIIDSIVETFSKGRSVLGQLGSDLSKQFKMAKYEITGKGAKEDVFGLKTITRVGNLEQGTKIGDFHSALGKVLFLTKEVGQSYNEMIGNMVVGTGALGEKIGETTKSLGEFLSISGGLVAGGAKLSPKALIGGLRGVAAERGLGATAVKTAFKGGPKALAKIGGKALGFATELGGIATSIVGEVIDTSSEYVGAAGHKIIKDFTTQNAGLVKSIAPLGVTIAALAPGLKVAYNEFKKLTSSAQDFEKSIDAVRKANENQLKSVRDLMQSYDTLADRVEDIRKAGQPETRARRMELGTYEAPLVGMQKIQKEITTLSNQLADANLNLVVGYDKLGNAVLRSTGSFKSYMKQLESLKSLKGVETEINVLEKFITDLTETGGPEKFKVAMKELAESFPVIGDLVARNIKIGPAKALELATKDLNKRINLKQKYPLSTAADKDIQRLQKVLAKARDTFQESYSDFEKMYGRILSPATLRGLGPDKIQELLSSPALRKAYELRLNVDPKFKLAPGVKAEDIMGKEILTVLNPKLAGVVDATAEFTKANLETAGIKPRDIAKVYSGDIVTLYDEIATKFNTTGIKKLSDEFDISGHQAIVKLKETTDGVFEWVAEYFNTKTLRVEERPLSDIEPFIESIFPVQKMKEDLSYRMDALNTFVAGASAGLVGITPKQFKKEFNLGERFFSEVPTTTLLQGNFGFKPGAGYGPVPGAEDFTKDIKEFYFKPMEELKSKLEQVEQLKAEGIETGDVTLSKDMYDEINKLLTVLKNNQVVLQFRAVFVDLMKEFSESERILKQNIAIMENRNKIEKETGGLLKGVSKGLDNYDIGITKFSELSPRQSLLMKSAPARERAQELKVLTTTAENQLSQLDSIQKALVNIGDVRDVARATGVALDKSNLGNFVEQVAKQADDEGPFKELSKINTKVADNTADTVDRLDKLLENQGDPEAIERLLTSFTDKIGTGIYNKQPKAIANALERVAEVRSKAEKVGNQEAVVAANKAIDQLTKKLVTEVGFEKGAEIIDRNFQLFRKDFTTEEFKQRAFSGVDPEVFLKKLGEQRIEKRGVLERGNVFARGETSALADSKEFKKIRKLQEDDGKQSIISARTLAKMQAAIGVASYIEKRGNLKIVNQLDDQIKQADYQISEARKEGKGEKAIRELAKRQEALVVEREKAQKTADFYGTVASLNAAGVAANELASAFGLTEGQIKALNVAAVGTYGAMKLASRLIGEELPQSAKDFEKEFASVAKKIAVGEKPGLNELRRLRSAGNDLTKDVANRTKEVFGKSSEDLTKGMTKASEKALSEGFSKQVKTAAQLEEAVKKFRDQSESAAKYDDIIQRQRKEQTELFKKQGGYRPDTKDYQDMVKKQNAELFEWSRDISKKEAQKIIKEHPYANILGGEYSAALRQGYGPEIAGMGARARRGAEVTGGTNRAAQAIAVYTATALTDYVSKKTEDKVALATLESGMRDQQSAIITALEKYPEASEKVLQDIFKEQEKAQAGGKPVDLKTITKSLVQDTESEYGKVVDMISEYNDDIVKSYEETAKKIAEIQAKAADDEIREADRRAAYAAVSAEKERQVLSAISRKFSLSNIIQRGLEGYGGDLALPVPREELNTQQRIYAESSESFKALINSYSEGTNKFEAMKTRMGDLVKRIAEEADIIRTSDDPEIVKRAKKRHEELNDVLKKQIEVASEYGEKLREFGTAKMYLDRFTDSIHQLGSALREVNIQETVDRLPGMLNFKDAIDKLLGGAHPEAVQAISTEEERAASRVGMNLQHLRSNRYDVEEARLREQLRTATGQQAVDIRQRLTDLPEQKRRDLFTRDQQRINDALKRSLSPFEQQLTVLERVRTMTGIPEGLQNRIFEQQKQMTVALEHSTDRMSIEDYTKELEANRKTLSEEEYKRTKGYIKEIEGAGYKDMYRGVPIWTQKQLGKLSEETKEQYKKGMEDSFEGLSADLISDPIVTKLDETNAILKAIAEKEFDISFEKQGLFSKLFGGKDYVNLSDYMKNKSTGGFISGPGSATSDSIPAWLSDGEYVIKASAAKRIGLPKLNYMNTIGKVPGFAEGGPVKDKSLMEKLLDWFWGTSDEDKAFKDKAGSYVEPWKHKKKRYEDILGEKLAGGGRVFKPLEEGFGKGINWLKEKRLSLAKENADLLDKKGVFGKAEAGVKTLGNLTNMGVLAGTQAVGNVAKIPLDILSGIEGASTYFAEKGIKGTAKDLLSIAKNPVFQGLVESSTRSATPARGAFTNVDKLTNQEEMFKGALKEVGKGAYETLSDRVKTGEIGVDIATGALSNLGWSGILDKLEDFRKLRILRTLKKKSPKFISEAQNMNDIIDLLPKNAKYLTSGAESAVFKSGKDTIVKINKINEFSDIPNIEGLLQPTNRVRSGDFSIDYFPKAEEIKEPVDQMSALLKLSEKVKQTGEYTFSDLHTGNIGLYNGEPVIIDAGAVVKKGQWLTKQKYLRELQGVPDNLFEEFSVPSTLESLGKTQDIKKSKNVIGKLKSYYNKLAKDNPVMQKMSFEFPEEITTKNQLVNMKNLIDQVAEYTATAPEAQVLGGIQTGKMGLSRLVKGQQLALEKGLSGTALGAYAPGEGAVIRTAGVTPKIAAGTFEHEVLGHHFDTETSVIGNVLKKLKISKEGAAEEFLNKRQKVDSILKNIMESEDPSLFPSNYSYKSFKKTGTSRELFADAAKAENAAKVPELSKAINDLRETTKTEQVKGLMNALYENEKFQKLRLKQISSGIHKKPLAFAEGGPVKDKSLMEKLLDWFWGTSDEDKAFKDKAGSYVEPWKHKKKRYEDILGEKLAGGGKVRRFSAYGDDITEYVDEDEFKKASRAFVAGALPKQIDGVAAKSKEWALQTLKEVNDEFLSARRGRGAVDKTKLPKELQDQAADEFMSIGAQYDTDMYREALAKKKAFLERSKTNKETLKGALSERDRIQAREAGLANIAGMAPDYDVMNFDKRRQLVRLDNAPVSYQAKKDLRLLDVDATYDPKKNLAGGYKDTTFMSDKKYAQAKMTAEEKSKELKDNLLTKAFSIDELSKTPYYISDIKSRYDSAKEIYENFDKIKDKYNHVSVLNKDKRTIEQVLERNKSLLERFQAGENPMTEKFMADTRLARIGGAPVGKGLGAKIKFDENNPMYKGLLGVYLRKLRQPDFKSDNTGTAYIGAPLAEEQKRTKAGLDELSTYGTQGAPTRATYSLMDKIKEMLGGAQTGVVGARRHAGAGEFINRIDDFFSSLFNRSPEAKHNGGIVHKTGLVFAKGGEVIGYQNGGEATTKMADRALNESTIKIDASELLSKLESIELKVEDKELKVEDKELKVEDKELKVEDKVLSVDVTSKIEVEQPTWKVAVDDSNIPTIKVEQPDWKIDVEVPTDKIEVSVNIGDADTRLSDAITKALQTNIEVSVTGTAGNAVGGEEFNQLAETVSKVSDRLITVKTDLEDKIKLLGTSNNQTTDIDRRIASIIDTRVANLQRDVNDIKTSVGSIESGQRQKDVYYDYKLTDLDYRLRNAMNITGIGRGGTG